MPHREWKETRPGRWERPQSCLEKVNLLNRNVEKALDRDNWAKTAVAKLEFHPDLGDPEAALRIAWKQVRYNYPEIAAFPYNGIYMYRIGNPEQVDLWVTATFSVATNTTVDELLGHIPRNEQMMCYYLPDTSEVLIRSPHYRLDARGAIYCLNHLIASLADLNPVLVFGGCAKNLSPSIDSALGVASQYTPEVEKAALKRLTSLEPNHPLLELTPQIKNKIPGATKRKFITLTKAETQALVTGCATSGLDLDAAIHAALIVAVTKFAPPSEVHSFMASFHSDLRSLVSKEVTTRNAPTVCTSVLTTEVDVSPSTNFDSYYKQLSRVYAAGYTPYLTSTACFHEKLAETKYPNGKATEDDGRAQPRFGALGIIDEQVTKTVSKGLVKVKDFWLGTETLTKRKMVHTWVWEGQMIFSCCFNESYWEPAFVLELLNTIKETLMQELGVVGMVKGLAV